jgi:ABC-type multidrug transport system fused ATPase/permease subunit
MHNNFRKLIKILFYDKKNLVIMIFFLTIQTISVTATPYLLRSFIQGAVDNNIKYLIISISIFLAIAIIMYICPLFLDIYYTKIGANIAFKLQSEVLKKLYSSKLEFLNIYNTSELLRVTTSDIEEFKRHASFLIFSFFHILIQFFSLFFYVSLINPIFFIVIISWYILFYALTFRFSSKISLTKDIERKVYSQYISSLKDGIQGNCDLRFLGGYKTAINRLKSVFTNHLAANLKATKTNGLYTYLTNICQYFANIILIIMIFLLKGKFKIDAISAFALFSYTFYIFPIVAQLFQIKGSYSTINGLFTSIYSILDNDSYTYKKGKNFVYEISNIKTKDFLFQRDFVYLIKGHSGCGKTTFLKKLLNLIESDIEVKVNDIEIEDIDIESYHKRICFIPQDVYIFDLPIYENIDLYQGKKSKEELKKVISAFRLDDLAYRFDESSGESGNEKVSGGEKKRIGIVRGIIEEKDKDLFIFDETFSNIDNQTKEDILKLLVENYFKDKIVIIVSHDEQLEKMFDYCCQKIKLKILDFDHLNIH